MGKRSRRHAKNNLGCMWSWISMFDFGHSRGNQKLLSDKRCKDCNVSDARKNTFKTLKDAEETSHGGTADACKQSVKKLIEEEMVTERVKKRNKISLSESESGGLRRRNQKKASKTSQAKIMENSGSDDSGNDLYIEAVMQEIFSHIQQKSIKWSMHDQGEPLQSEQKLWLLQERIREATKAIMHHKFLNGEHLTEARKVQYYNKYMDTLELLDANKEFFLQLSEEDPKKMPGNQKPYIDLRISEEQGSSLEYAIFRRKLSSRKRDELDNKSKLSEPSSKIVILKPERTELPTSASSPIVRHNAVSQFSLGEIRKNLRLAMQRDRLGTFSGDGVSMSPYKNQKLFNKDNSGMCSPSRSHFYVEKVPRPSTGSKLANKVKNISHASATTQRASSIYIEAKRQISELLNTGDEDEGLLSRHAPKMLKKILSVPESSISPRRIPGSDSFDYHVTGGRFEAQPCNKKSQEIESVIQVDLDHLWSPSSETDLCPSDDNPVNVPEACNPNSNMGKEALVKEDKELEITMSSFMDESTSQGGAETTDSLPQLENSPPGVIYESTTGLIVSSDDHNICTEEINEVEACSEYDEQDVREEYIASAPSPLEHPFFSAINIDTDDLASPIDKSERPSPISVLDNVFSENELSPSGTRSYLGSGEPRRLHPIRIQFDEDELSTTAHDAYIQGCADNREIALKFVEAVLSSTELCWEKLYLTSLLSSHLLEESLFFEVERLFSQLSYDDCRLLFDSVNEILHGMSQRYSGGCPLISFLKLNIRPFPKPQNAIHEVWEGVEWHLLPPPHPQSLEQIVRKDLERDAAWMDLRLDVEGISVEMEITILQELMEDVVLLLAVHCPIVM